MSITSSLDDVKKDNYWLLVSSTIMKILEPSNIGSVDDLKNEIQRTSPEEQILFYHTDPLEIASEITGKIPTEPQVLKYIELRDEVYNIRQPKD